MKHHRNHCFRFSEFNRGRAMLTDEFKEGQAKLVVLPQIIDAAGTNARSSCCISRDTGVLGITCMQVKSGVIAYFGGAHADLSACLSAFASSFSIPHIDVAANNIFTEINDTSTFTLSLYPARDLLDKAYKDLITYLNWTRMGVIYEDYGLGELNTINTGKDGRNMLVLRCSSHAEYRPALALLKAQRITHVIVDTDPAHLHKLFRAVNVLTNFRVAFELESLIENHQNTDDHRPLWTSISEESLVSDIIIVSAKMIIGSARPALDHGPYHRTGEVIIGSARPALDIRHYHRTDKDDHGSTRSALDLGRYHRTGQDDHRQRSSCAGFRTLSS
ncbi:Glutamate receptor ionotropic, kainate 1 [Eumeta japonica]|uniref:Glutamate receptor ionotropic, kainate 1 n=1 Tax=Eumeta variegata TaxID=151549 RepID=A0A4C1ZSR3_EUMVA|nr:Glutamate receptor ionotropic, kainate 1 [Eumeta japonica]